MNGKNIAKKIIWTLAALAAAAGVLIFLSALTMRKDSADKNRAFHKAAAQTEVLFLGSSHVINAVDPVQLFEEFGITSYNLGGHGSQMPETYWELRLALEECSPRVVVIDTYMLEKKVGKLDERPGGDTAVSQLHLNMDAFPLTKTKISAVQDLIADKEKQKEFLLPLLLYHSRWEELTRQDYDFALGREEGSINMGGEIRCLVERNLRKSIDVNGEVPDFPEDSACVPYLRRCIELCQERGIVPVITFLPFNEEAEDEAAARKAEEIADHYGVPFVNMRGNNVTICYETDLNDNGHLNLSGMRRVTRVLGQFLKLSYDLTDYRGSAAGQLWQDRVPGDHSFILPALLEEDDLFTALMLLGEMTDPVTTAVYVRDGSSLLRDPAAVGLLSKLISAPAVSEPGCPYFIMKEGSRVILNTALMQEYEAIETSFGTLHYLPVSGYAFLNPAGEEENYLDPGDRIADLQILVFDAEGSVIKHLTFSEERTEYVRY